MSNISLMLVIKEFYLNLIVLFNFLLDFFKVLYLFLFLYPPCLLRPLVVPMGILLGSIVTFVRN